jgi:hypothetical protein
MLSDESPPALPWSSNNFSLPKNNENPKNKQNLICMLRNYILIRERVKIFSSKTSFACKMKGEAVCSALRQRQRRERKESLRQTFAKTINFRAQKVKEQKARAELSRVEREDV